MLVLNFYEFLFKFVFLAHFSTQFLCRKHLCRILDLLQGFWCHSSGDKSLTEANTTGEVLISQTAVVFTDIARWVSQRRLRSRQPAPARRNQYL